MLRRSRVPDGADDAMRAQVLTKSNGRGLPSNWQQIDIGHPVANCLSIQPTKGGPRGDRHLLGFVDRPQPRRSSDATGVAVSSASDFCFDPIGECVLGDQFGKTAI